MKKLNVAVVDDDESMHEILKDLYENSSIVNIDRTYLDPAKFIKEAPVINFDLCLLDISMPGINGLVVAQVLGNKPYIFITGSEDKLKEALNLKPIDIVTKPFNKERLDYAFEKAYKQIGDKIEYGLFNIAECSKKIKLYLPDFLYVTTDEVDSRNKCLIMNGGIKYTLMDYKLEDLMLAAPHLVKANRHQLVAMHAIHEIEHDTLTLKNAKPNGIPGEITLSPIYKEALLKLMFHRQL
jgi:two-component system LytT family response regulator